MRTKTENQSRAFKWWDSLSINEMKKYTDKYYPNFTHILIYKMGNDWIENIYNKEIKDITE